MICEFQWKFCSEKNWKRKLHHRLSLSRLSYTSELYLWLHGYPDIHLYDIFQINAHLPKEPKFAIEMERSKYALVFSDHCKRNENILEYVKKQVQKHHLNCEMDSCKDPMLPNSTSVLVTATFDWLAIKVNICIKVTKISSFIHLSRYGTHILTHYICHHLLYAPVVCKHAFHII